MKKIIVSIFTLVLATGIQSASAQSAVINSTNEPAKVVQSSQVDQQNLNTTEAKQAEATKVQSEQAEKAAYVNQLQQNKPAVVAPATSEKRKSSVAVKENQK